MGKFQSIKQKIRHMSKKRLGIAASMVLLVVAAISAVALNAKAEDDSLPDGFEWVYVKGFYVDTDPYNGELDHVSFYVGDNQNRINDPEAYDIAAAVSYYMNLYNAYAYVTVDDETVATVTVPSDTYFNLSQFGKMPVNSYNSFFGMLNDQGYGYGTVTGISGKGYEGTWDSFNDFKSYVNGISTSSAEISTTEIEENTDDAKVSDSDISITIAEEPGEPVAAIAAVHDVRIHFRARNSYGGSYYDNDFENDNIEGIYNAFNASSGYGEKYYYRVADEDRFLCKLTDFCKYNDSTPTALNVFYKISTSGGIKIPMYKGDGGSYYRPEMRVYYGADDDSSYCCYIDENNYYELGPFDPDTSIVTTDGYNSFDVCSLNDVTGLMKFRTHDYTYYSALPVRVDLKYDTLDAEDENEPKLSTVVSSLHTRELGYENYGYINNPGNTLKISGADKLSKEGVVFDHWQLRNDPSSNIEDGAVFCAVAYQSPNESNGWSTELAFTPGYSYRGLDANTGEILYEYVVQPVFRSYNRLKYKMTLPNGLYYLKADGDYWSAYDPIDNILPVDDNQYHEGDMAVVQSKTYEDNDCYRFDFVGWLPDRAVDMLVPTSSPGEYKDAAGNIYSVSDFKQAGDLIDMSVDHTLYGIWAANDPEAWVPVTFKITNGKFANRCDYGENWYTSGPSVDCWSTIYDVPENGGSVFLQANSNLQFYVLSKPNEGYDAFFGRAVTYYDSSAHEGDIASSDLPCSLYNNIGYAYYYTCDTSYCDNSVPNYVAPSEAGLTFEIEYTRFGPCTIYFYENSDVWEGSTDGTVVYVNDLYQDVDIELSDYFTLNDSRTKLTFRDVYRDGIPADGTQISHVIAPDEFDRFKGWIKVNESNQLVSTNKVKSVTFRESEYTVCLVGDWGDTLILKYDGNGADEGEVPVDDDDHSRNESVTVSGNSGGLAKQHHKLIGWAFHADATEPAFRMNESGQIVDGVDFFEINEDTTLYAVWQEDSFSIEYVKGEEDDTIDKIPDNVSDLTLDQVKDGNYTLSTDVPTRTGYTFKGWSVNDVEGTLAPGDRIPFAAFDNDDDKAIATAEWERTSWTITYSSGYSGNDSDVPDASLKKKYTDEAVYGGDYIILSNDSFTHYSWPGKTFKGWKVTAFPTTGISALDSFVVKFTGSVPVGEIIQGGEVIQGMTEGFNLVALWDDDEYTVTYDANDADSGTAPVDTGRYKYNDKATAKSAGDLAKEGFRFSKWNTAPDGSGQSYSVGARITVKDNTTLYAIWVEGGSDTTNTGESTLGIWLSIISLIIAAAVGSGVFIVEKRRRTV